MSTTIKLAVRRRRGSHRVKTGCMQCRLRRLKCDELKPVCNRCRISRISCSYHLMPYFSAPTAAHHMRYILGSQPGHSTVPALVDNNTLTTWEERRASHLFRTEMIDLVAGAFHASFWKINLLQAIEQHPMLWYAANALTAMYQRQTNHSQTPEAILEKKRCYNLALLDYNKCIKYLLRVSSLKVPTLQEKIVILVTTVILTALCNISGNPNEAYVHTRNGLNLFQKWEIVNRLKGLDNSHTTSSNLGLVFPAHSLIALFTRLDNSAVTFTWKPAIGVQKGNLDLPKSPFQSISDVFVGYEIIVNGILHSITATEEEASYPGPCLPKSYRYRTAMFQWEAQLQEFVNNFNSDDPNEIHGLLAMQMRQKFLHISISLEMIEPDSGRFLLAWDRFSDDFRSIIDMATQIRRMCVETGTSSFSFSFAPAAGEVLGAVGCYCRDPIIRREAIDLLKTWPSVELIWDLRLLASIAEAVMIYEESGIFQEEDRDWCECIVGKFVCLGHRATFSDLEFTGPGAASFTMTNVNDFQTGKTGCRETFKVETGAALYKHHPAQMFSGID